VCIEAIEEGEGDGLYLMLDECNDEYKKWTWKWVGGPGRRELLSGGDNNVNNQRSSTESYSVPEHRTFEPEMQGTVDYSSAAADECDDSPVGWYDIFGRNCEWYGKVESNCAVYGDQYANFGRTALLACLCAAEANLPPKLKTNLRFNSRQWVRTIRKLAGTSPTGMTPLGMDVPGTRKSANANTLVTSFGALMV
jgi:hypothetical protein